MFKVKYKGQLKFQQGAGNYVFSLTSADFLPQPPKQRVDVPSDMVACLVSLLLKWFLSKDLDLP